jgi:hypothetical protein
MGKIGRLLTTVLPPANIAMQNPHEEFSNLLANLQGEERVKKMNEIAGKRFEKMEARASINVSKGMR